MSSGEWDLRALKALEEEEQKAFLALSRRSIFEPPSPPTGERLLQQTQKLKQQQFQPKLTYAQLYPHILKLPTINECNLIAAARRRQLLLQQQNISSNNASGRRLKFTRPLSLSANSLTARSSAHGKKVAASKSKAPNVPPISNSGSPPRSFSASPVYTPPPIRRCETHYQTQPVRKAFKTLQQLEKQKKDCKIEAGETLKRVLGTNNTYWKYGANSTAASIIGQRKRWNSSLVEIESNTSDEFDVDCDDSATETGSCTVPLASNSIEMMRLMLSAATAAVTTHKTNTQVAEAVTECVSKDIDYLLNERPLNSAGSVNSILSNGMVCKEHSTPQTTPPPLFTAKINGGKNVAQSGYGSTFLPLSSRYPLKLPAPLFTPEEKTVAFKAFHEHQRRKSLSYNGVRTAPTLQRGRSLAETSVNDSGSSSNSRSCTTTGQSVHSSSVRNMLKANSLDMSTQFDAGLNADGGNCTLQSSTLITNPMTDGKKTASTAPIKGLDVLSKSTIDVVGLNVQGRFDKKVTQQQQQQLQNLHLHSHPELPHLPSMLCIPSDNDGNCHNSAPVSNMMLTDQKSVTALASLHQHVIDNELEQHIKHCSCSCNHMGYGNSMDYQLMNT
ncbi:uncharacterized protein LOC128862007 [Anastrepha ludens]|uniref:uncharacterized protein LOC128862007 n=1 Tax=Anastrepha ludens TaxID=28586 RepID=UPI0023AFFF91|nr:uncharacterized protein LOC128862007 [Anastrepha ludens]